MPEEFEIDQREIDGPKLKTELDFAVETMKNEEKFMEKKNGEKKVENKDLL